MRFQPLKAGDSAATGAAEGATTWGFQSRSDSGDNDDGAKPLSRQTGEAINE